MVGWPFWQNATSTSVSWTVFSCRVKDFCWLSPDLLVRTLCSAVSTWKRGRT